MHSKRIKKFTVRKTAAAIVIIVGLTIFMRPHFHFQNTIILPQEDIKKTKNWKTYENSEYHFSFKYPEYLLSNFQVNTNIKSSQTLIEIKNLSNEKAKKDPNAYNVIFEADAWKYEKSLDEFLKDYLPETEGIEKTKIKLDNLEGIRISNTGTHSEAYFEYNLFKNDRFIYNLALLSDESILIEGNTPLLHDVISTVEFE